MNREHRNIAVVGLTLISLLLFYTIFSERGLLKGYQLAIQRDAIIAESSLIGQKNEQLSEELKKLSSNIKIIERAARSQLDLVREDEILYKFVN